MIEQFNLFNVDQKKYDIKPKSKEDELKKLFGDIEVIDDKPKIRPTQQKDLIFALDYYFRANNGDVDKIAFFGVDGIEKIETRNKRNKKGEVYKSDQVKYYKVFYAKVYVDGEQTYYPYTQLNTLQTSKYIIDCIYPNDIIYITGNIRCIVIDRVIYKKQIVLLCKDTSNNMRCVYNNEIIRKQNKKKKIIWAKDIEKGDEVKHWKYGWFKVVSVWHKKIMVQTKTGTMMIKEHDICDHSTNSEKEN